MKTFFACCGAKKRKVSKNPRGSILPVKTERASTLKPPQSLPDTPRSQTISMSLEFRFLENYVFPRSLNKPN